MSDENETSPSLLTTLRQFKPSQKPKLSHMPMLESSSDDGSPVKPARRPISAIMIISDSDSESDGVQCLDSDDDKDDCVIVSTDSKAESIPDSDSETKSKSNHSKEPDAEPATPGSSEKRQSNDSDDDCFRPMKRKRPVLKNKKNKRRKRINSDSDDDIGEEKKYQKQCVYDSDEEEPALKVNSSLRVKVVELLDNGTELELYAVPNMNPKKLELIVSNRPYTDWKTTEKKFSITKGLTCSMLNVVSDSIVAREQVLELMTKCEKYAAKIESKISSGGNLVSKSPSILNPDMKLSGYQLVGLNWLALMRSRTLNSILADEMGLGKTIQVIAFLAYLKENELVLDGYPHLVVVPSSTLNNWYEEFQRWCPSLNVTIFHGTQVERRILRHEWNKEGFGDTDVVLTTYSCACTREEKKLFQGKEFNYIIFDEAHMLKNMNTQRYDFLIKFNGNFKILLTGTPLQNNLLELMSLLIFLMPDLFKPKVDQIKLLFSKCTKTIDEQSSEFEKEKLTQAKRIIEPFMLRRLKENVLKDLPPKTVSVEKCPMLVDQQIKYNEILDEYKALCEAECNNDHMIFFMKLRKIANHPLMLRYHFTEDMLEKMARRLAIDSQYKGKNAEYIQEDLYFKSDFELYYMCQDYTSLHSLNYSLPNEAFCNSGKLEKLTPKLNSLREDGHRVLIFSQFITILDILQEYCRINQFTFVRLDGSTPTADRQELIDLYNMDEQIFIFLLSTKAGGLGINLTSADTVIIHDIDFNPYNDKQAEDRCHRVGQKKPVQVIKLVSENTIEENMHKAAMGKLHLEREITTGHTGEEATDTKTVVQLLKESLGLKDGV
ncbi:SWI/SNF-related matrix-associated actin-dependent regulator of chromatin subfamily A containing DEAD/H box 1 homolog [Planococcus citri]|uniref:SWI/SNF-related matrix-associated actin-dependent regulator of chromatin subfamily A containing DEAD/H box 1 homolog n=1 Tax=Planococcus citri TaxID=170843 RepID=UPI0031F7C622